jgi:hypothetical protein
MRGRTLNRKRNAAPSKLIAQRLDAARSIESAIPDEWLVRKPNLDTSIIRAIVLIYRWRTSFATSRGRAFRCG